MQTDRRTAEREQPGFFAGIPRSFAEPGLGTGRIGVVDAGSNSVRLVIFEGGVRSPAVVHNEKVMCALGARLAETGALDPAGRTRALAALRRFAAVAECLSVATLAGVATAAIRDARDGPEFREQVERETGIRLQVASGTDEAHLAGEGVLFGSPGAKGVAVDLGGASMELCVIGGEGTGPGITTPLGPFRLLGLPDPEAEIQRHLGVLDLAVVEAAERLYLVGGAWRALARAEMERTGYPLKVLHEYTMPAGQAHELARWARRMPAEALAELDGVSESRAPVLPMAARLLRGLLGALDPDEVVISGFGLREGMLRRTMPCSLRVLDPLLAACADQERLHARAPGFGAELADWLLAAMPPVDAAEARLLRAAALLADVNWRTHPDARVQACWEAVTRVTITDLGHRGRCFMGLALAVRYRKGKKDPVPGPMSALLDEETITRATAAGLFLRLGCTLAASAPGVLSHCSVENDGQRLALRLNGPAREMAGEDVDKRLAQLARYLGREAAIETV